MTDAERLAAIRERCERATPGPWIHFDKQRLNAVEVDSGPPIVNWPGFDDSNRTQLEHRKNADFIAHARDDVPYLLALVERLTAENERLQEREDVYEAVVDGLAAKEREKVQREMAHLRAQCSMLKSENRRRQGIETH